MGAAGGESGGSKTRGTEIDPPNRPKSGPRAGRREGVGGRSVGGIPDDREHVIILLTGGVAETGGSGPAPADLTTIGDAPEVGLAVGRLGMISISVRIECVLRAPLKPSSVLSDCHDSGAGSRFGLLNDR